VLVSEDGICSTDILVFRASEKSLPEFLCLLTHSDEFVGHAKATTSGVQHPRTAWASLREFKLHVPPLAEQRKIAEVLGLVQRAMEQQERLIALTTELKKALLHQLFTQGLRGEPQKQTEIGPVPQSWEVVKMGSLGKVVTGTTPKTAVPEYYTPPEVDFIAPADLGQTRHIYSSEKKISRSGFEAIRRLPKDAVLCVCIGSSIGKVGMTAKDTSATNQQINSIICHENHDPTFIYYLLNYFAGYWRGFATFGPVPILSKGAFEAINIVVPPTKDEETEIAECFRTLDAKAEVHMRRKVLLTDLFRTLLHQLMTAQLRVHDLDLPGLETFTGG
jgi:type I restriction enzyme S subunit